MRHPPPRKAHRAGGILRGPGPPRGWPSREHFGRKRQDRFRRDKSGPLRWRPLLGSTRRRRKPTSSQGRNHWKRWLVLSGEEPVAPASPGPPTPGVQATTPAGSILQVADGRRNSRSWAGGVRPKAISSIQKGLQSPENRPCFSPGQEARALSAASRAPALSEFFRKIGVSPTWVPGSSKPLKLLPRRPLQAACAFPGLVHRNEVRKTSGWLHKMLQGAPTRPSVWNRRN